MGWSVVASILGVSAMFAGQGVLARPPRSREDALTLAREQYAYDYDAVEQGTGTLEVQAATAREQPLLELLVELIRPAPTEVGQAHITLAGPRLRRTAGTWPQHFAKRTASP